MEEELRQLIEKYGICSVHKRLYDIMFSEFGYLSWIFEEKVACVYGIFRKSDNQCIYVGSSFHYYLRLTRHYHDYSEFPNRKLYRIIRESGGWKNYNFKVIEMLDDISIMYFRENYHFKLLKPIGNSLPPPNRKLICL